MLEFVQFILPCSFFSLYLSPSFQGYVTENGYVKLERVQQVLRGMITLFSLILSLSYLVNLLMKEDLAC